MSLTPRLPVQLLFAFLCSVFFANGQTVTITNGVQKYGSLTSTTVNMSGTCELWVTNSSTPISGCTINLNSSNSLLFLSGVKPSVAVSTYLSQVRVGGASAVADSNVRVVQYGQYGAVIIPQSPSFQPLQVFSGPNFSGTSSNYNQYTYYIGTGLGSMDMNISSFKLKRGYMVVFAQNTSGSAYSKCYVAQDGDLEIGILPSTLSDKIRFIYVTPWRWVSKKGIAGNIEGPLNVLWKYNWNLDQNSTRDLEYVPIRQQRWWPSLSQDWKTIGANTVLGYNEPDKSDQANIAVGDAIWSWPDLLGTGLRVGAPAVSDGGRSGWLYPFIQQADAAGLRVDFVPIHYYWCYDPSNPSGAASQMYNFLKATYDQVKRPLWVTEWNNGASWTSCTDPTYAQQQAAVSAMIDMLESAPFVERYALYNWVEDVRRVEWDDGSLTDAGVTYSNKTSSLSYSQTMPDNGTRSIAQYLFETNTIDSSGYCNNALASSAPAFVSGHSGQAIVLDGANNYVQLPANIASSNAFTFAAWIYWKGGGNWQRIFDFGNDTSQYLFLTPSSGSSTLRFAINSGSGEQILETSGLSSGSWNHVAVTLSGSTARLYLNGTQVASSTSFSITPATFTPTKNYLGKSQFSADPLFNGYLDDVEIADYAFSAAQIASLQTNLPPQFSSSLIDRGSASPFSLFSTNITGTATDPDSGNTVAYSKLAGPSWLTVNSDGTMSGTPGAGDGGTNYFTVQASDAAGASAFATVLIYVPITYGSGTWITDADGGWDYTTNWNGGLIANGGSGANYTADFSTLNITANRTVTLGYPRIIGTLKFGDTSGAQTWTLTSAGNALTLDTGSSTSPSIVVNQNTATIITPLAGTNGFTKSGAGTLILSNANSFTGALNVDSAQPSSGNDGVLRLAAANAAGYVSQINILNQNAAYSTLQLDGSATNISSSASIGVNGRTANVAAIQNTAGTNTLSGTVTINTGGSYYIFQSDAGSALALGGITSAASGYRTLTFQGSGDINVSGVIANGSATNSFIKYGSGNLTLSGANTLTGTNRINAGSLTLANSAALQTSTLDMNASDAGSLKFSTITNAALGGLTGTRGLALTNTSGAPVTLSIGTNGLNCTYFGSMSGSGNLVKTGSGTQTLSGVNTFNGTTRINAGILALGLNAALLNSTLNLDAGDTGSLSFGSLTSATIGNLAGTRSLTLTNNSNVAVTLTVGGNGQNSAYAGTLGGSGSLIKSGSGTLSLSSTNSYSGNTIVAGGTLKLSRDPVLKLSFDNTSGTGNGSIVTNDGTGGGLMNGQVVGSGANITGGGKFGNGLSINGVGGTAKTNVVAISNRGISTDATGSWTVSFWIKTTTLGAVILYQGDGTWSSSGQTTFLLNANSGSTAGARAGAVRWAGGFLTGTTTALTNGAWHFITLVDTAGTESIYVDGNLDTVTSSLTLPLATGANQIWIGGAPDYDAAAVKINGMIDEVSMFNRALNLTEIRSLTNSVPGATVGSFGGQLPATTPLFVGSGATFDLGGNSQNIASLSDYSGAGGTITNSGAAPVTLTVGGSSSTTFSGSIIDLASSNAVSLVKSGSSTLTLGGANTYRGTTAVNAGTLLVNGSLGSGTVTVAGGATLGGNGTISGPVTVQTGAILAPGTSIGQLTVTGNVTLQSGSTTVMEISHDAATNDALVVGGTLQYGGTLTVTNMSGTLTGGDSFKLFTAGTYANAFSTINLPTLDAGLIWNFAPTTGVLSVIATNATTLSATLSGAGLTISWPTDHLGWRLQSQTNALSVGLGTNWFDVPNTANTNQVTIPTDAGNGSVFYRLVYP